MAYYSVVSSFPVGESEGKTFRRRDAAFRYAWNAVRAQYEAQALLDRQCAWTAVEAIPADLRTILVAECGRKVLVIPCGEQRAVSINAGRA